MSTPPTPARPAQTLRVMDFALHGSHLIEASAGTGKTWTIAALYVRLVLGAGLQPQRALMPPEILVMTFTRAATRELSDRIRARLAQAAQVFRGTEKADDDFLQQLLQAHPNGPQREQAAYRLALAAQAMDEAAVYTIDGWCQRMLREHALDTGNLFDETLLANEAALRLQAVQDYWRQQLYPLDDATLTLARAVWPNVRALAQELNSLLDIDLPEREPGTESGADAGAEFGAEFGAEPHLGEAVPATAHPVNAAAQSLGQVLGQVQVQRQAQLQALKAGWVERAQAWQDWLQQQLEHHKADWNGRKLQIGRCQQWLQALAHWAQGSGALDELQRSMKTGWDRLTLAGLRECRQPHAAEPDWPPVLADFAALQQGLRRLPDLGRAARRHARAAVLARLQTLKRRSGQFGFADMPQRLLAALQHPDSGERLAQRLRQQFAVALVDEFQDTSPLQLRLLDAIYRIEDKRPDCALLLIGDPKQSIYGFRGADIYSYLQARAATEGRHHVLDTNFRSTHELVAVVNHFFGLGKDLPGAAFDYRSGGHDPLPFMPVRAHGREHRLHCSSGPVPALTWVHDGELRSERQARQHMAALCAEQIVAWLSDPLAQYLSTPPNPADKPDPAAAPAAPAAAIALRPQDIAVLVRTGKEAQVVRAALRERGVASVYLSDRDSVLASDEAADLCLWLQGVASAHDLRAVRAALGTATVGLSLAELQALADDELLLDAHVQLMRELHQVWRAQGVLAMLRQTVHRLQLARRWRVQGALSAEAGAGEASGVGGVGGVGGVSGGERRLTNVLHLAELLQEASQTLDGEQALIRWLAQAVADAGQGEGPEEQVLRLESDEALVRVITIHKSKGLEYPVVCLPFAHAPSRKLRSKTLVLQSQPQAQAQGEGQGQGQMQGGASRWTLDFDEADLAHAERERLREDLRLWYVALTRARHALWVGFSPVRQGNSKECANHLSAPGHLLGGGQKHAASDWPQVVQRALAGCGQALQLQWAPETPPLTRWQGLPQEQGQGQGTSPPQTLALAERLAAFDRHWTIASFSRLARDLQPKRPLPGHDLALAEIAPNLPNLPDLADLPDLPDLAEPTELPLALQIPRPADDEPLPTADAPPVPALAQPWHRFARGPSAGNFLHDQLEWLASERFALAQPSAAALRLQRACERAGFGPQAGEVQAWLQRVVQQSLHGPGVALSALDTVLPEMEFWLPAEHIDTPTLDSLCQTHLLPKQARPALARSQLHGMLMGFVDLVFEHQGRYWVLDYKSNHLGPDDAAYSQSALQQAMLAHRYDVQATLYLLALHRLLRSRLGAAYQPQQHLGGAVYFFLRGVDGPAGGCCTLPAPWPLLQALDAMLQGQTLDQALAETGHASSLQEPRT